jgi:hypothetical protein
MLECWKEQSETRPSFSQLCNTFTRMLEEDSYLEYFNFNVSSTSLVLYCQLQFQCKFTSLALNNCQCIICYNFNVSSTSLSFNYCQYIFLILDITKSYRKCFKKLFLTNQNVNCLGMWCKALVSEPLSSLFMTWGQNRPSGTLEFTGSHIGKKL